MQYHKLLAPLFAIIILSFSCFFLFSEKKEFSENENRYLEKFPSFSFQKLWKGDYTEKIKNYTTDHFLFRDSFMNLKTSVEKMIGKKEMNGVYIGKDDFLIEVYQKPENTDLILKRLNDFYQTLNYVNMSFLLSPTSSTIYEEKLPSLAPKGLQTKTIETFKQKLKFNFIDTTDLFLEKKKDYLLFYRTDHHWTTYGAYYAYVSYCYNNDLTPVAIDEFEIKVASDTFRGTIFSKVIDTRLKPDTIYFFHPKQEDYVVSYVLENKKTDTLYNLDYLEKKDQYSVFLDNNHPLITIENQLLNNGKELLVIKDSYANSMVSFLTLHYEKVHVIDPRFYTNKISDYVKENTKIKDVLLLYNVNTIDHDTGILSIR